MSNIALLNEPPLLRLLLVIVILIPTKPWKSKNILHQNNKHNKFRIPFHYRIKCWPKESIHENRLHIKYKNKPQPLTKNKIFILLVLHKLYNLLILLSQCEYYSCVYVFLSTMRLIMSHVRN